MHTSRLAEMTALRQVFWSIRGQTTYLRHRLLVLLHASSMRAKTPPFAVSRRDAMGPRAKELSGKTYKRESCSSYVGAHLAFGGRLALSASRVMVSAMPVASGSNATAPTSCSPAIRRASAASTQVSFASSDEPAACGRTRQIQSVTRWLEKEPQPTCMMGAEFAYIRSRMVRSAYH